MKEFGTMRLKDIAEKLNVSISTVSRALGKETSDNDVTVTHDTKTIIGIKCIVVHDTVTQKGVVKEDTFDWYAQDKDGTVWYMGEDTKEFLGANRVSTEGSWEAGVDGAEPGIMMVKEPKPGGPFYQEYYAGHAEDMTQFVALNQSVTVPYGTFADCIKTKEWSMLESGYENKWYCKGLGVEGNAPACPPAPCRSN